MEKIRVDIPVLEGDDVEFIHLLRVALAKELAIATDEAYVVKIDSWFGENWLQFAGKILGALGVSRHDVRVPPFHPNRVISERHFNFDKEKGTYIETPARRPLHIHQSSDQNLTRKIRAISSSCTFVWYSGDTQKTGRGSLMVYVVASPEKGEWYAELIRGKDGWRMTQAQRGAAGRAEEAGR